MRKRRLFVNAQHSPAMCGLSVRQRKMAGFTSHPDSTMLPFALSWVLVKTHPEISAREDCPVSSFDYDSLIAKIPNYPEPGVLFRDITPLIGNAQGVHHALEALRDRKSVV